MEKYNWIAAAALHGGRFYWGGKIVGKTNFCTMRRVGSDLSITNMYMNNNEGRRAAAQEYCEHFNLQLEAACMAARKNRRRHDKPHTETA